MSDLAEQVVALEQAVREMRRQRDEQREQLYRAQQACMSWEADLCEMRGKLRVALTERDALRVRVAIAFREGWNCGDWQEGRDNVSAREYDWNHSAAKAALDAAMGVQP